MIFTGRSVDALDEVRGGSGAGGPLLQQDGGRRDVSAVAIAAGWFSSLRRPGKRKKSYQKQAKSAWDLTVLSTTVSPIRGAARRARFITFIFHFPRVTIQFLLRSYLGISLDVGDLSKKELTFQEY